jgi:predicted kinase
MAVLVLLNGPPASGKSTIAQRFVDARPLSLNLDIDVVRGTLGDRLDNPSTAGLTARSLALVMAETHLAAGRDVIVPQFLGHTDFIGQLANAAERSGAACASAAPPS